MRAARPRKVLFVCIGNCVRSQMAEAFARVYGKDVMAPSSGGMAAAGFIADETVKVMAERGVPLDGQFSKSVFETEAPYDIVVNMAGVPIPRILGKDHRTWPVPDPMGMSEDAFRAAAQDIENRVMALILELRRRPAKKTRSSPAETGPFRPKRG
jgi:protein-tyrosine-phosphatase